jgi:hypothetical protein
LVFEPSEAEFRKGGALVDPSRPLVLAAARYASSNDAIQDYEIVWGARHGGAFDHMSVTVLAKDTRGSLQVGRHGSTAKDLALGSAVLCAALLVVAPAVDATVAVAAGGLPGAKGIAAHLRDMIPDERLRQVSELLGLGECGLLIVAIDRRETEISPLLEQAEIAAVVETKTGDMDAAFYGALGAAITTGRAALYRDARATGPMRAGAWQPDLSSA